MVEQPGGEAGVRDVPVTHFEWLDELAEQIDTGDPSDLKRVRFMIEMEGEPIRDAALIDVARVGENIVVVVTPI